MVTQLLFKEQCKLTTDTVEQEIIKWHGGRDITLLQALKLLEHNYPLGAFKILPDLCLWLLPSGSYISNRILLLNGECEIQRDVHKLNLFFSSYESKYNNSQIKESVIEKIRNDLMNHCMAIIRNTCEFGG